MLRKWTLATATVALVLAGASATAADQRYEDPVGDVTGGVGPDIVAVTISEPWESLVSFEVEFATDPSITYDLETMATDSLAIGLSSRPDARVFDEFEYMLMVHGATLPQELEIGSALYDSTQPVGDEVFWRVVDVAVDGPTVTLTFDWKLVGDPDTLAFFVAGDGRGRRLPRGGPASRYLLATAVAWSATRNRHHRAMVWVQVRLFAAWPARPLRRSHLAPALRARQARPHSLASALRRLRLHLPETGVVVRELLEVGEGDLACHGGVASGHVGLRVMQSVLQLDVHAVSELLHIEWASVPVDADLGPDATSVIDGEVLSACHRLSLSQATSGGP